MDKIINLKKAKFFISLLIIINILLINSINAKLINSGHDIISRCAEVDWPLIDNEGTCSFCHVPHSAAGKRLWKGSDNLTAAEALYPILGEVGVLCYTCHFDRNTYGAPSIDEAIVGAYDSGGSHRLIDYDTIDAVAPVPNTKQKYSNWSYTKTKRMECSSCHDVHDQNNGKNLTSPTAKKGNFLRAKMYDSTLEFNPPPITKSNLEGGYDTIYEIPDLPALFCSYCHLERAYESSGFGTHPINKYPGNSVHIDKNIFAVYETTPVTPYNYDDFDSPTGGHLSLFETGTIICNTCHKAHGAAPGGKLLVMDNRHDVIGGASYGSNALCEACHDKKPSLSDSSDIYYSHPVDRKFIIAGVEQYTTDNISLRGHGLYMSIPDGWPVIDSDRKRGVVCLSCHKVHQAQKKSKMLRGGSEKGDKRICDDCHSPTPKNPIDLNPSPGIENDSTNPLQSNLWPGTGPLHGTESHPVHIPLNITDDKAVTWPNTDWLKLFDTLGKPYNTLQIMIKQGLMSCETCHNVHRAYSATALVEYPGDNYSEICVGCHTDYKKLSSGMSWVSGQMSLSGFTDSNTKRQDYLNTFFGGYYSNLPYADHIAGDILDYNKGLYYNTTVFGANPSSYIIEYNSTFYASNLYNTAEFDVLDRLGTHPSGIRIDSRFIEATQTKTKPYTNPDRIGYLFKNTWEWTDNEAGWQKKYPNIDALKKYGFSNQKSMWGTTNDTIICQSCHTPHGAALGLVEYNPGAKIGDAYYTDATPNSALLLGNNIDSNLCTACHRHFVFTFAEGTTMGRIGDVHELSIDLNLDSTNRDFRKGSKRNLLLEFSQEMQNNDFPLWEDVNTKSKPANFPAPWSLMSATNIQWDEETSDINKSPSSVVFLTPTAKLVCDSCHSPHAAETSSGSRIFDAVVPLDTSNIRIPWHSKNPGGLDAVKINLNENTKNGARHARRIRDVKFCEQCHGKRK